MKPDGPAFVRADEDVSALIKTLLETGERLEELTAGEVDTVADGEGRTFLLRRAQEQLRHHEAAKQAAILNALPAHVALLDAQGRIVCVNDAWRQFGAANKMMDPGCGVGSNYVAVCDAARGGVEAEAREVAEGIRSVLAGVRKTFSLEYRCDAPTEPRWFMLTVAPLADESSHGAVVMHLCITEQRRGEDEMRQSERRLADMLSNVTLFSLMLDRQGRITHCNDYLLKITGWAREEVIGRDWFELFIAPGRVDSRQLFDQLMAGESSLSVHEDEIVTRSGGQRVVRWHNTVLRSASGEGMGTAGIGEDITERQKTEAYLAQMEGRYRGLLEAAPDAMVVVDQAGEILLLNLQAEKQFGYRRDELVGQKVTSIIPVGFAERLVADGLRSAEEALAQQIGMGIELDGRRKDGSTFPIEIMLSPLDSPNGVLVTAAIRDITRPRNAKAMVAQKVEELRRSDERFRELADNILEVFWLTDPSRTNVLYISPAYEKIWGRSCASLYETPGSWSDAIHGDDRDRVQLATGMHLDAGDYDEQYRIVRSDGSIRWIHERAFPVRDAAGHVCRIAGVAEDVTARRSLEEQVRQSQKMEAIGTLAGGIAHDFNNILAVINGYVEMLRGPVSNDAQSRDDLEAVALAAARAGNLVRQILTFSRQENVRRESMKLGPVIEEAVKFLRCTLPSSINMNCTLATDAPFVLADATQVHQIVMNLGTNAWHAMRDGRGTLDMRLETCDVDGDPGELRSGLRPGRYARLSVSDTGKGMEQATIDRIFEPFFTTKPVGEGSGLGLAVVHGIVESHQGAITVQSRLGHGTVFQVYLPAHAATTSDAQAGVGPSARGRGERILYVDDEMPLVRLGKRVLERLGYVVESHDNVEAALALVRAEPQRFDVVVTDQTMPGMTGIELARQITSVRPDLPVILMTGHAGRVTADVWQSAGIREVVLKPSALQTLGDAVQRALAEGNRA